MKNNIKYETITPVQPVADYIKIFWHLTNEGNVEKKVVILPDGYFDVIFYSAGGAPFQVLLVGLSTEPSSYIISARSVAFAVSFKLPAAEYILKTKLLALLNGQLHLPPDFWQIKLTAASAFADFADEITAVVNKQLPAAMDAWKRSLFKIIYSSNGLATVKDMAKAVHWSSRQINRYFTDWFGLNLKTYCNILRYRASFKNLKEGKLFPEEHFSDQAHFIRQIKKYSGVTPGELAKNENDRFIQFSTLPDK